jgi:hypothetical protein
MIPAMDNETGKSPGEVIVAALFLAGERMTGDDLEVKMRRRQALADTALRVQAHDSVTQVHRPTAEELTGLLGDPDDGELRRALAAWG